MNYPNLILLFISLLLFFPVKGQDKQNQLILSDSIGIEIEKVIEDSDTLFLIYLHEIYVFPKLKFKNKQQEKLYWKTVRDVKKVLPYARIASKEITNINKILFTLPNDKARKKRIKIEQKRLFKMYEKKLKRLTVNQGRMLMRLIEKEQEANTYELISLYKNEFYAMFWNTIAHFFGSDLKSNHKNSENDKIVERVIILVENGQL